MIYRNGRLPASALAPIPGGRLRKDAAAAWNAMVADARTRGMAVPMPDGPDSSYRNFARQVFWKDWWCQRGHCKNAATPGTSRHGLGIAVDCAEDATHHAATIDAIGEPYGWSKKWSDAPWEPWHNTYKPGLWHQVFHQVFVPNFRYGSQGPNVLLFTQRLVKLGYLRRRWWHFNRLVHSAVMKFQREHHLSADGVVGPVTWALIKGLAAR